MNWMNNEWNLFSNRERIGCERQSAAKVRGKGRVSKRMIAIMCALCLGLPKQTPTSNSRSSKQRNWRGKMVLKKASNQIETKCLLTVYAAHVYDTWALLYRSFHVAWAIQCLNAFHSPVPSSRSLSPPHMIVRTALYLSTASRLSLSSLCRLRGDFSLFLARSTPPLTSPIKRKLDEAENEDTIHNGKQPKRSNSERQKLRMHFIVFHAHTHTGTHARSHAHTFRNSTQCDLHCC